VKFGCEDDSWKRNATSDMIPPASALRWTALFLGQFDDVLGLVFLTIRTNVSQAPHLRIDTINPSQLTRNGSPVWTRS
jgi:hypothetical protein